MIKAAKTLSAALIAGSAITISQEAFADDGWDGIQPDGKQNFYNRATDTVILSDCKSGSCTFRVVSNQAQIDLTQKFSYQHDAAISGVTPTQRKWSGDTFTWTYTPAKDAAEHKEWAEKSEMAESLFKSDPYIVQNEVMKITLSEEQNVRICSYAPTGEKHGLEICMGFNDATKAVQLQVIPVALHNGAVVRAENASGVERPYNKYDGEYYARYVSRLQGQTEAYSLRK